MLGLLLVAGSSWCGRGVGGVVANVTRSAGQAADLVAAQGDEIVGRGLLSVFSGGDDGEQTVSHAVQRARLVLVHTDDCVQFLRAYF
ncbi:hypothetical protein [Lentzea flava]|uniref:hypothetical protein n=1 Tax=Lentzea flava TaxID=103732 RepID=UPI0016713BA9